jgi:signal transduction histidine kinase
VSHGAVGRSVRDVSTANFALQLCNSFPDQTRFDPFFQDDVWEVTAMATEMRKTGVDVVGDIPWGTHFCLFYETRADLLETLVTYCKAGLENQEFCLWVVAEPLTSEDARHALKRAVPDLDQYLAVGYDQTVQPTVELVLRRTHPEDRALVQQSIDRAVQEMTGFDFEHRLLMPDGSIKYIRVVGHPAIVAGSSDVKFVGAITDVTDRERLRQAQADLAHINRVATMGELTASLAHEIKQPISAALTDAKTCQRWLGRDEPDLPEAREAASRLVKDVTRAADIISSISSLFKKGALQRELIDVNELIREMIVLLRSEANRYSISIRTELAADLPKLMADRVQLQQVFMNLMLNGIDAMKKTSGGGELTIKSEADDGQLLISVSDTGAGLSPEQEDKIFGAFFTTKEHGTGMGLPISRSIIESHGGRLWFAGNSGRGITFQFTLPRTMTAHA